MFKDSLSASREPQTIVWETPPLNHCSPDQPTQWGNDWLNHSGALTNS